MADIGNTIADNFKITELKNGTSFLNELKQVRPYHNIILISRLYAYISLLYIKLYINKVYISLYLYNIKITRVYNLIININKDNK